MPLSVLQTPLTSAHPAQMDDTLVDDVQHNSPAGSFPLLECTFQQHNSPAGSFPLLECTFQHMSHTSLEETYMAWLALVGQTNMAQNKIGYLGWRNFTIPFAIALSGKACATLYVEMQIRRMLCQLVTSHMLARNQELLACTLNRENLSIKNSLLCSWRIRKQLPFYFYVYFERSPPAEEP
jgi:hypothetical protein